MILVLSSFSGCFESSTKLDFNYAPEKPTTNEDIQFISITSEDIQEYLWDFGDGDTSVEQKPTHRYDSPGSYQVILKIWNNQGGQRETSKNITIDETINAPPEKISLSPKSSAPKYTYLNYMFYASSTDPEGNNITYKIDWGDNNTGSTPYKQSGFTAKTHHAWNRSGNYTISIKAIDELGAESNWSSINITIDGQKAISDFNIDTLESGTFRLSDYGNKVVIISFSSIGCGFCDVQIDEFDKFLKNNNEAEILSVYVKSFNPNIVTIENVTAKKNDTNASWMFAIAYDDADFINEFIEAYKERLAVPTSFIIDKDGFVVYSSAGYITETKLEEEINKII